MNGDLRGDHHNSLKRPLAVTSPLHDKNKVLLSTFSIWTAITICVFGCFYAFLHQLLWADTTALINRGGLLPDELRTAVLGGLLALVVLRYDFARGYGADKTSIIVRTSLQVLVLLGLIFTIGFFTNTLRVVPRAWMVAWSTSIFVIVIGGRLILLRASPVALIEGMIPSRVAVVGEPAVTGVCISHLHSIYGRGVSIVGQFHDRPSPDPQPGRYDLSELLEFGKCNPLDKIVLVASPTDRTRIDPVLHQLKSLNAEVVLYTGAVDAQSLEFAGLPDHSQMVTVVRRPLHRSGKILKFIEDQVLGSLLILWTLPVLAVAALAIKLDSPGPVLIRQQRHGLNNAAFQILKFRTMVWEGASAASGVQQTERKDRRITRVGRFLRRSSLDELPQLLNVVRGEMSLVGPRPHPVVMRTAERLCEEIVKDYAHRHRVKPGLTGLAQINGFRGATTTEEQLRQRVKYDLIYIDQWSIFLDLKILALTPIKLIFDGGNAF